MKILILYHLLLFHPNIIASIGQIHSYLLKNPVLTIQYRYEEVVKVKENVHQVKDYIISIKTIKQEKYYTQKEQNTKTKLKKNKSQQGSPKQTKNQNKQQKKTNKKHNKMKENIKTKLQPLQPQRRKKNNQKIAHLNQNSSPRRPLEKQNRNKEQVFQQLFNDHRVKQLKKKMITEQTERDALEKKISKAQFQAFIQRSDKFLQKVNKKQQILSNTSRTHDLKSGAKLFEPTINKDAHCLFPSNKPKKSHLKKDNNNNSMGMQGSFQQEKEYKPNYSIFNKYRGDDDGDEKSQQQINYKIKNDSQPTKQLDSLGIQQDPDQSNSPRNREQFINQDQFGRVQDQQYLD